MKKSLLALAVLGAFAGVASAQSSVTLFGVVDQSVNYQKTDGRRIITLDSNQLSSNRIGFKGFEDLGSGLQAGFWLEAGMNNDVGTAGGSNGLVTNAPGGANPAPNAFFNRRSTVSLISKFGEVRIGRDYTPTFWNMVLYDVYGANGIGEGFNLANLALGTGAASTVRANNSVAYWLPAVAGGFYGRAMVAGSEGVSGQKYYGGSLNWAGAGLDVGAGVSSTKIISRPDLKDWNIGASYDFGVAKIYGFYNVSKFDPAQLKTYELSVGVPLGASVINASYTGAKYSGNTTGTMIGKADQYSLQYIYNLSKRTALYGTVAHLGNKNGATFGFGDIAVAASKSVTGANVGIRHSF
ncbi:MAG TPA: porin [Burkholderiaceae bacterium]